MYYAGTPWKLVSALKELSLLVYILFCVCARISQCDDELVMSLNARMINSANAMYEHVIYRYLGM